MKHQLVSVALEYPVVSKHCFEKRKRKPNFLSVLYLEVERCKGEYMAKDKNVILICLQTPAA